MPGINRLRWWNEKVGNHTDNWSINHGEFGWFVGQTPVCVPWRLLFETFVLIFCLNESEQKNNQLLQVYIMDVGCVNSSYQNLVNGQRPDIDSGNQREASTGTHLNYDVGCVEGRVTDGLKSAAVRMFLSDIRMPMKFRSIAGLSMKDL
ncbi:hypothetical protein [Endozoicomonas sp. SCSIO W0465]|uniref:hypothetical protein n=1 Tax=Endozoicomonas sp. SCSIO W0465 TaxID=2918516 RepID=UPI0020758955|nr:hypothetical protein [Endozoicomonas sp. SCSIO W0465]USE37266.1 hypothetical protein MJO57_03275 [Endozoicomonas sp. SCSIO W0465]